VDAIWCKGCECRWLERTCPDRLRLLSDLLHDTDDLELLECFNKHTAQHGEPGADDIDRLRRRMQDVKVR
jgi:hypothetical protein